jgi:hypothetical protein
MTSRHHCVERERCRGKRKYKQAGTRDARCGARGPAVTGLTHPAPHARVPEEVGSCALKLLASPHVARPAPRYRFAYTAVLPVESNVTTSYGSLRGPSMPGEPIGMPGTAIPFTFGRSFRSLAMTSAGTCPSTT